jgi:hypothetical protein
MSQPRRVESTTVLERVKRVKRNRKSVYKTSASAIRGLLVLVVAALFLFIQGSWAATVCLCDHSGKPQYETASHHKGCHGAATAQGTHKPSAAVNHSGGHHRQAQHSEGHHRSVRREQSPPPSKDTSSLISAQPVSCHDRTSQPDTVSCCQPRQKADPVPVPYVSQEPVGVLSDLPLLSFGKPAAFVLVKTPDRGETCPLYLAHSSLLI